MVLCESGVVEREGTLGNRNPYWSRKSTACVSLATLRAPRKRYSLKLPSGGSINDRSVYPPNISAMSAQVGAAVQRELEG
jgi:hypothetical protein